jgi:outer membrane murein-binding lipoprotein Lpp
MTALLCLIVACCVLAGCSNNLSEDEVVSKLEAAGLTMERLNESLLTYAQRQRIENDPETVISVRITDADGRSQTLTLVGFDLDWKADNAKYEGVPGFVVRNWLFAGVVSVPEIQKQIESALK